MNRPLPIVNEDPWPGDRDLGDIPLRMPRVVSAPVDPGGVSRATTDVPISPVGSPDDTVLFQQPGNSSATLFLPRYRIADQPPLQVFLSQGSNDWTLTVDLDAYRAPEIEPFPTAAELPHAVSVVLRSSIMSAGMAVGQRELPLDEVTRRPDGIRAVLRGTDSVVRDQVYLALTDQVYAAELVLRRSAQVAVPVGGGAVRSSGEATLRGTFLFDFDSGVEQEAGADVWWEQMTDSLRQLVPQGGAEIASLGSADFDGLGPEHLATVGFSANAVPGNVEGPNDLVAGNVFALRTTEGNYTKVLITSYGYDLTLRWVTYLSDQRGQASPDEVVSTGSGVVLRGTWLFDFDGGGETSGDGDVWWEQMTDTERQLVARGGAGLAVLRGVDYDSLTAQQLTAMSYPTATIPGNVGGENLLSDGTVFAVRTNAGNVAKVQVLTYDYNLTLRWTTYPPASAAPTDRYLVTTLADDAVVAPSPFVFPKESPTFVNIGAAHGSLGLTRQDLRFADRLNSYYQDQAQPWKFYYLPDEMRLARRLESPHPPWMSVQMTSTSEAIESTTVTLSYVALPVVDEDRLAAAQVELARFVPASVPDGVSGPVLQPLSVARSALELTLTVPTEGGSSGARRREGATVDLRSGVADSLTMSLPDFRAVYDALFSDQNLFHGTVEVRLGERESDIEHVPLLGSMANMSGPVLDSTQQAAGAGQLAVTLTNPTESTVAVGGLAARLLRGTDELPASVRTPAPPLPTTLPPGGTLRFTVVADQPLPDAGALQADVVAKELVIQPAPDKVWPLIFRPQLGNAYTHTVSLQVFASAFAAPPDRADDAALELNVDFQEGAIRTVQVTPDQVQPGPPAKATVPVAVRAPIIKWLLNQPDLNEYTYRITVIRPSGAVTGGWTRSQSEILTIQHVPTATAADEPLTAQLPTVAKGDKSRTVAIAQGLLRAAKPTLRDATLVIDGTFGAQTLAQVTAFQTGHDLPASGKVDSRTWALLLPDVPRLELGDKGPPVNRLQGLLRAADRRLTESKMPIDGDFGRGTLGAVKATQKAEGLPVTGVVALPTWRLLLRL